MSEGTVIGLQPRLPGVLGRCEWLTKPVAAERLAALRIGVGLVLLLDAAFTYWPFRYYYFGPGSLAEPDVFAGHFASPHWSWSLLRWFPELLTPSVFCSVWLLAAISLVVGVYPRAASLIAWALAISANNSNPYLHNSGDLVRQHLLFYLMLTPCGAAWSVCPPRGLVPGQRALVAPWALRLLFVQLVVMYFFNGVYKLAFGASWQDGHVLHHVLHTPGWSRWSPPIDLPVWLTMAGTYLVLGWELTFPLLVVVRPTRIAALVLGATFHVVTFFNLEVACFGLYALCFYLPLLPWEKWEGLASDRPRRVARRIKRGAMEYTAPTLNQ